MCGLSALVFASCTPVWAQTTPVIPAKTNIEIAIVDPISTKTAKPGDRFRLSLAEPVLVNGSVVLPAGVRGEGEVVHAAKGGLMGKAGELILAARFLDYEGQKVPLGGLRWGRRGQDNTNTAMVVGALVGIPSVFVTGGNIDVPAGTLAEARITTNVTLNAPPVAPAAIAAPVAPATPTTDTKENLAP